MGQLPEDSKGWHKLLCTVARATHNKVGAEDLLHEAFLRLAKYGKRKDVKNPYAFLVRIAVNLSKDEFRHQRVRNRIELGALDLTNISTNEPLQCEALISRERLKRVEEGLAQLSPRTREIFLMHRIDGLKYPEIAERMGITVSAIEKHIAKASLFLTGWVEGW